MKKTIGTRRLTLRREHIRVLSQFDLMNVVGGAPSGKTTDDPKPPPPTTATCTIASNKLHGC